MRIVIGVPPELRASADVETLDVRVRSELLRAYLRGVAVALHVFDPPAAVVWPHSASEAYDVWRTAVDVVFHDVHRSLDPPPSPFRPIYNVVAEFSTPAGAWLPRKTLTEDSLVRLERILGGDDHSV
jgi:hypothetical protein